jgi:protein TonB
VIWDERETRLVGACVAASVALHAAALALGPRLRHTHVDPPQVLSVVLAAVHAPESRVQEPLAPPPPPRPEIPHARARVTPAPLPRREPEPTTASRPEPAAVPSESHAPRQEPAPAPVAPPAGPPVAARESVVAPDFRAAYLNNPSPAYPRIARRNGEQGTVTLRVHVSPDGVPTQVELERSSGSNALDSAALETVKHWRFTPARRAGDPVAAWVIVPVVFRLTPES